MPVHRVSPETPAYNCIAWAAEEDFRWWWPDPIGTHYWPEGVKREETLDAFIELFRIRGYEVTESSVLEPGYVKIAIFCDSQNKPTHAARQASSGLWTSKLGSSYDVEHDLHDPNICAAPCAYGRVAVVMRRRVV
mgnify:CR=1 FL=1